MTDSGMIPETSCSYCRGGGQGAVPGTDVNPDVSGPPDLVAQLSDIDLNTSTWQPRSA